MTEDVGQTEGTELTEKEQASWDEMAEYWDDDDHDQKRGGHRLTDEEKAAKQAGKQAEAEARQQAREDRQQAREDRKPGDAPDVQTAATVDPAATVVPHPDALQDHHFDPPIAPPAAMEYESDYVPITPTMEATIAAMENPVSKAVKVI